ncbi:MAG: CRISPR-associated endoribonuclease Cas6 [Mariniphaga sp.]
MRFKLNLSLTNKNQNILPVNYQYELSAWIYKVINQSDPDFALWLHEKGFSNDKKQFRLFTFSNLIVPQREIIKDRLIIKSDNVGLIISTLPEETIQHFVSGVFCDREFAIGDQISSVGFKINSIEALQAPDFTDELSFRSLSPLFVSGKVEGRQYAQHFSPQYEGYLQLLINNLKAKFKVFTGNESIFNVQNAAIELLSTPKQKGITIKAGTPQETKLVGYQYNFKLKANAELLRMGYYTGFGEKNSMGFGCCQIS